MELAAIEERLEAARQEEARIADRQKWRIATKVDTAFSLYHTHP